MTRNTLPYLSLTLLFCAAFAAAQESQPTTPDVRTIDGFRGIWFDLGQRSEYGSKYSGGLGTYTAKHRPLAIHVPDQRKTFFVYGGTTAANERHLLAMISYYDHDRQAVAKPVVVHDKQTVNDPHDNPSLGIDGEGHLWVFVSGRGRVRPGYKYRSRRPYDITSLERVSEEEFTYPQPWWTAGAGFLHLFTRYTDGRELYWNHSDSRGENWTEPRKLAGMGGHYQMSEQRDSRVITAFNMHPGGNVDRRTNLYFLQSDGLGETWTTAEGTVVETPLTNVDSPALVRNYAAENRLVYLKDIAFDTAGRPVLLYLTSGDHRPGPGSGPRVWTIAHHTDAGWQFHDITQSTHNYDMGSLYIESDNIWRIIAPTAPGPQRHGTGGEIVIWRSEDAGQTWQRELQLTHDSERNHAYVRRPVNAHPSFYAFWADGNPDELSKSFLYFTNKSGDHVWQLPYDIDPEQDFAQPRPIAQREKEED